MGELVVGLSKTVLEGVIIKAHSAIDKSAMLRQSARLDLAFITGELEMMQTALISADEERVKNAVEMAWLRQIRELASDVQDWVELVVHLETAKTSSLWRRLLPTCTAAAALRLDEAVGEIEQLKARVEDVSRRNERYRLIADSAAGSSKPLLIQQQPTTPAAIGGTPTSTNILLVEARDAAERTRQQQQGFCDLTQLITREEDDDHLQLEVISVWGTGGDLGIVSLIREAYKDPQVCPHFPCRAWVKLMHPFNSLEFMRCLLAQFYANSHQYEEYEIVGVDVLRRMNDTNLLEKFERLVREKRYLVVLEDLSNMVEWDAIRTFLPDRKNGSWIIVSTQQFEIASLCVGHPYQVLELQKFSVDHSVYALYTERSQGDGGGYTSHDKTLAYTKKEKEAGDSMEKYPLVGRESEMNQLRKYIPMARFNASQVMSVWGIAGVGKSALVRNLYCDMMRGGMQFNYYSWVDVSHPFNLRDFCRNLLSDFRSKTDPIRGCRDLLGRHDCLIVIDDLRYKEEWDLIQTSLAPRFSRSVIIVITTEASIATYCTNSNQELVFNVKGLEADAAFDLFKNEVHRKNPSSSLKDRRDVEVQELISKCGGLPKVIVAIAGLLAEITVTWMDTVHSLNRSFMHHLETNTELGNLRGLLGWMHSYFRACPDFLKQFILYLSIFPRDHMIRRRRLVRRWVAESYTCDSVERHAEEHSEDIFLKLLDMGIIHKAPPQSATSNNVDAKMVMCQVNGFIREYLASWRMEENLVCELGGSTSAALATKGPHLVILKSWKRDSSALESIDLLRLQSMTVFGEWKSFFISENMKKFRVLDLEDASGVTDDDLEQIVTLLPRLRFLSLRGCRGICQLPDSLADLGQLQTLDVRDTSIDALPRGINKLQELQYIRAGTVSATTVVPASASHPHATSCLSLLRGHRQVVGVPMPKGFGELAALHTLGVVKVGASGGKAVLKKLTQLRKLGVSGINRDNSKKFFAAISGHGNLVSFSVRLDKDNQGCLDDIYLPWENLQSLKLYGLGDKLPLSSDLHLTELRKLYLEMETLEENDIKFLAKLPKLHILRLGVKQLSLHFCAEVYEQEIPSYEKVKVLDIACSSRSLHVIFGSRTMHNLELLKLDCSSGSTYRLSGLNHQSALKEVLLKGTNDESLKTDLQSQLDNHPKRPVVKLEEQPRSS